VIEARFDDVTGREPSMRLTDAVGVLEAATPSDVAGVVAAAEAAAGRGLWVAGVVAYEAAPGFDPSLRVRERAAEDPFARFPLAWFALFERREHTVLPAPPDGGHDESPGAWMPSVDRSHYDAAISAIREHIAAGDTYQVNHTLRLRSRIEGDERGLYRDLCFAQRGAYSAYVNLGRYRVLSTSPELFFRIDGSAITTRPMKGTAPRGRWFAEDEAVRAGLLGSVKDRAENAMIVDLLRNDIGRVARPGSVRWTDVFEAERYETVWQLTSTVGAELRRGASLLDVFRALFPSGSVTGAPKVRTMELIAELEDSPRGIYCGAVGYLSPGHGENGPRARFNVAIRTVAVDAETEAAEYGVGGGITWDSRAGAEYEETVAKARVLTSRRPRFQLFETLLHHPENGFRYLREHLERLRDSATYFGFPYDETEVLASLAVAAGRVPDRPARVRLMLDHRGKLDVGAVPMPTSPEPVHLEIDTNQPVDPADVMLFHKTTLRSRYEQARARHPDADDVILTNVHGDVTETTIANVAARLDGRWWTPPLEAGLLPGTERAALLAGGTLSERALSIEDLGRAEDVAVLNSLRGWRRATVPAMA
jgi:para-aminobenzoate synthetase/4-amino-4-deoxychorismate lyase